MKGLQAQLVSRQWASKGGVTGRHRFVLNEAALSCRRTEQDDDSLFPVLLGQRFDSTLILKVHGPSGGSDKTLRGGVDNVRPETLDGLLDRGGRDSVSLSQDDDFLSFKRETVFVFQGNLLL